VNFPESLPIGLISSNSYSDKQIIKSLDLHSGPPIIRRMDDSGWTRFSVTWNFDEIQMRQFKSWLTNSVNYGAATFEIKLKDEQEWLGLYQMRFESEPARSLSGKRYIVSASLIGLFLDRILPAPPSPPSPFTWDPQKVPAESNITWISESVILVDYISVGQTIAQAMGPLNLRDVSDKVYLEFSINSATANPIPDNLRTQFTFYGVAPYPVDSTYYRNPGPNSVTFAADATLYSGYPTDPSSNSNLQYYGQGLLHKHERYQAPGASAQWAVDSGKNSRAEGDIMMLAFNFTNGRVWFGRNGVWDMALFPPSTGTDPSDLDYADMGPAGSDITPPFTVGSKGRGNLDFNAEYFPVFTFFPNSNLNVQANVTIYGNDEAPFNYTPPPGYN
jgi:hypothetical protein